MRKITLILILLIIISSCKKADAVAFCDDCLTFYFENPQPDNDSELRSFPSKFKGLYVNKDSSYIRIEEDRILSEYFIKFKVHKHDMDSLKSEYNLVDGKLITKDTREDLIKLDSVTAIKGKQLDSISYLIRPTRREFKNILKIKHLGTDQEFIKVSE